MLVDDIQATMPATIDAVPVTRRMLGRFGSLLPDELRDDLLLVVSELMTNAVRYGRDEADAHVELRVTRDKGQVTVRITNVGHAFESVGGHPGDAAQRGWGLFLVRNLSDDWGIEAGPRGPSVWARLALPRRATA